MENFLRDSYGRQIRDLRISLTDRCNFRCFYCLPNGEPPLARKETILTFEEISYVSEIFVHLGVKKIRLTGGEPLLRRDIEKLVKKLAKFKTINAKTQGFEDAKDEISPQRHRDTEKENHPQINTDKHRLKNRLGITNFELRENNPKSKIQNPKLNDLALTTNGFLLAERAEDLKRAGLDRVTISLDSLRRENFQSITGVDALEKVLSGIEAAKKANLSPIKINAVIARGRNDDEVLDFAKFARDQNVKMRFIEFMPLDSAHLWRREMIVSGREIFQKINKVFPLVLKQKSRGADTARRYEFADGAKGEIGIIAPVTEMFCGACSRIRLTADGQIRTCLFSTTEHNLRGLLRNGASREEIVEFIQKAVVKKEARHHIGDSNFIQPARTMSFIGG